MLDKTKTAMGKRLLRSWLEHPLLNITSINNRQSAIEELVNDNMLRMDVTDTLSGIFDIERLMTRIVYGSANARDLRSLAEQFRIFRRFRICSLIANQSILNIFIKALISLRTFILLLILQSLKNPVYSP